MNQGAAEEDDCISGEAEVEAFLRSAPTGPLPKPPIDTKAQSLPVGELHWPDAERLFMRLLHIDRPVQYAKLFGVPGQSQAGIDAYARLFLDLESEDVSGRNYATLQSRRVTSLTPGDIRKAVDDLLEGEWADRTATFYFATSFDLQDVKLDTEIRRQTERLAEFGISFVPWGVQEVSRLLKNHPDIVCDFFGPPWVQRFCCDVDRLPRPHRLAPAEPPTWTVDRFSPSEAGVHRAIAPPHPTRMAPEDQPRPQRPDQWWDLPPYVVRDHDIELRERLASAAATHGGFVLVTGASCTGKTRSIWEAVRSDFPRWHVVRPRNPEQVRALAASATLQPRTIVWLDELQRYVGVHLRQQSIAADDVRALWRRGTPIIVVATLWPALYDEINNGTPQTLRDPYEPAWQLLELAGTTIRVPDRLLASERDRAQRTARNDEQLRVALADPDHGMTQVLAGAPWLIQRWEQPKFPYTRSVLMIAAAARRLGVRGLLPAGLLRDGARSYFPDRRPAPAGWFDQALDEATHLIRDTVSALVPECDPNDDERAAGYTLTDYLAQYTTDGRGVEPVPEAVWRSLAAHVTDPCDLAALAHTARSRLLYRHAERFYRQAIAAGHEWAHQGLVSMLTDQGRVDEAVELQRSAPVDRTGSSHAVLVSLLVDAGHVEELRALAETDGYARKHLPFAVLRHGGVQDLLDLLKTPVEERSLRYLVINALAGHGRRTGTFNELRGLAESGDQTALTSVAQLLSDQGRGVEAVDLLRRHGTDGYATEMTWRLLLRDGRVDEAIDELQRSGTTSHLIQVLVNHGRFEQLRAMPDEPHALRGLAWLLHADGRTDEAIALLRGAPPDEFCQCPIIMLATLLADSGHPDKAIDELRRTGERYGPVSDMLATLLAANGRRDELRELVDAGNAQARREWARQLAAEGQVDEAVEQLVVVTFRMPDVLDELGMLLVGHDRVEDAFTIVRRYSEPAYTGDRCARLAYLLAAEDRTDDLRRAANAGNREAGQYLSILLALNHPPDRLARAAASGEPYSRDALIHLATTGHLRDGQYLRSCGLNPDGCIALDRENTRSAVPATIRSPEKAVLLPALFL